MQFANKTEGVHILKISDKLNKMVDDLKERNPKWRREFCLEQISLWHLGDRGSEIHGDAFDYFSKS